MEQKTQTVTVTGTREVFGNLPDAQPAKNPHAVALGQKAYGKVKTLTDEERARRSAHAKKITADRIAKRAATQAQVPPAPAAPAGPVIPAPSSALSAPSSAAEKPAPSSGDSRLRTPLPPSSPAKRVVRYVAQGKVRSVPPSSRAYPARRS
jgi:hypothetical protein